MRKNIIKIIVVTFTVLALTLLGMLTFFQSSPNGDDFVISVCEKEQETGEKEVTATTPANQVGKDIYVHVCGAVRKPGVYCLPANARVCDAIQAAKGLKKKASDVEVNQAEPITDGQQIYIPFRVKKSASQVGDDANSVLDAGKGEGKININTASIEELKTLTGIGDAKATSIVQYREEHGSFKNIEELKSISGIKDGVYNKIVENITV